MSLQAILVTENSLDMIAEVNGGARPEVETPISIFIHDDDANGHNEILPQKKFFATYWYDWNIMDNCWTEVKKL